MTIFFVSSLNRTNYILSRKIFLAIHPITKSLLQFLVLFISFATLTFPASSQNHPYRFDNLSSRCYTSWKDSIKHKWKCPKVFEQKKTQTEYESYWDERSKHLVRAIDQNDFVQDTILFPYLIELTTQLTQSNKVLFPEPIRVLVDRSNAPNAYAMGEHIIAINAGLFAVAQSREELAFYIAHELAHDLLKHSDNAMQKRAVLITSDDYIESLKDVMNSKYERYSRLKKVLEGYSFDRRRHSRLNESEADSFAIILLRNSGIPFDATVFLNLDTADNVYKRNLINPAKTHFENLGMTWTPPSVAVRSTGLSAKLLQFKDTTHTEDSLKTHPDCKERYQKTISLSSTAITKTPLPLNVRDQAIHIALLDMFMNRNIGHGIYRILQASEEHQQQLPLTFLLDINMYALLYSSKQMYRFNTLGIERKQDVCTTFFDLQELLSKIPEVELETYCTKRSSSGSDITTEQAAFLACLQTSLSVSSSSESQKAVRRAAKAFKDAYPQSPFLEYLSEYLN